MTRSNIFLLLLMTVMSSAVFGQRLHTNVFPNFIGESLIIELRNNYKTSTVLDYSTARDTLFSKIDSVKDSLTCIYSGHTLYMDPRLDPTVAVYLNGITNGINTEHSWPESKGASGLARSDMHHLYPSKSKVNSNRNDHPMAEIPDNQTKTWFLRALETGTIPSVSRDLYAESTNDRFEPRESVKGNIARSLFYFYTMYKEQADAADPDFFNIQKDVLCNWAYLDPVDQTEWNRTKKIAIYQGKENPFVLDCSLVSRAYCNNIDQACEALLLSSTDDLASNLDQISLSITPNPSTHNAFIKLTSAIKSDIMVVLINAMSGEQQLLFDGNITTEATVLELSQDLSPTLYIIHITDKISGESRATKYIKM